MLLEKFTNTILNCEICCVKDDNNNIWFRGKSVAEALGYKDTGSAVQDHIDDDDKSKLQEIWVGNSPPLTFNEKNTIYINESGLYSLILRSNKEEAKQFKKWITKEVLPSIRKTGEYSTILPKGKQLSIMNEKDLHYKVVEFIRSYIKEPLLIPGLGEYQSTSEIRCDAWAKGYKGGQPDIMLLNYHKHYKGLCIEFKTPSGSGTVSDNQQSFLSALENNNFKTLVSNDVFEIIMELMKYSDGIRYTCQYCKKKPTRYRTVESRDKHYKYFHKMR